MSKKDYIVFAKILADAAIMYGDIVPRIYIAEKLAEYFESDNRNFDKQRFFIACKV